jgi:phosphate transport system protein
MHEMIDRLRGESARMAGLVQQSVETCVEAAVRGDVALARSVVAADERIDELEVQVERSAIDLLSLYRPAAGEFRLALMIVKVNNELERLGDCAANVAERVPPLVREAKDAGEPYGLPAELIDLGSEVAALTRQVVRALNFADADAAEQVIHGDDRADALYAQVTQDALSDMRRHAGRVDRDFGLAMVAKNLERIGDHCTNVAEDIVYICRGEIVRHRHAV